MGAQLDDPNREAVGVAPIWSSGDAPPEAEADKAPKAKAPKADPEPAPAPNEDNVTGAT